MCIVPEDPDIRRRRKILERILKQWQNWGSLVQSQNLVTITVDGEEYHYFDMLKGLAALPPRQRQAVFAREQDVLTRQRGDESFPFLCLREYCGSGGER